MGGGSHQNRSPLPPEVNDDPFPIQVDRCVGGNPRVKLVVFQVDRS